MCCWRPLWRGVGDPRPCLNRTDLNQSISSPSARGWLLAAPLSLLWSWSWSVTARVSAPTAAWSLPSVPSQAHPGRGSPCLFLSVWLLSFSRSESSNVSCYAVGLLLSIWVCSYFWIIYSLPPSVGGAVLMIYFAVNWVFKILLGYYFPPNKADPLVSLKKLCTKCPLLLMPSAFSQQNFLVHGSNTRDQNTEQQMGRKMDGSNGRACLQKSVMEPW